MKILYLIGAIVCFISAYIMYSLRNDSHVSELGDFAWVPLPLALLCVLLFFKSDMKKKKDDELLD